MKLNKRFKSKFADYFGKKGLSNVSVNNNKISNNKTSKYIGKFDKYINFTNLKNKYRTLSNDVKLQQNIEKNELEKI